MAWGLSMNRDSQTPMTNDQIPRNDEIRRTKPAIAQLGAFGHSGFGFVSSLVIRHWSFNDLCKSGSWSQCMRKSGRGLSMNLPLPVNCPVEPEDRDRSPVAARDPRQEPGKITEVLVLARPLRAGTARGPNPTKEFDGRSRQLKVNAKGPKPKAILPEAPVVKNAI